MAENSNSFEGDVYGILGYITASKTKIKHFGYLNILKTN